MPPLPEARGPMGRGRGRRSGRWSAAKEDRRKTRGRREEGRAGEEQDKGHAGQGGWHGQADCATARLALAG
jgi:hypothetical protein